MKVPLALCAGGAAAHMPWVEMNRPALMHSNIPTTITAAFVAAVGPKIACTGYRANSIVRGKTTVATAAAPPPQGAGTELGEDERGRDRQKLAASVEAAVVAMPRRPKCAVVGGGFAGLATAYHLAASGSDVTVYDPNEVGTGGASSVAAGLLHPLTPRGKKIWKGEEGLFDAKELIEVPCTIVLAGSEYISVLTTLAESVFAGVSCTPAGASCCVFARQCTCMCAMLKKIRSL